jgi:excisionase family DNA binding protein
MCLSVGEAAEALGIGRSHTHELVRQGRIPSVRFGRRVLIPRRPLERMLEELEAASADHDPNLMP